MPPKVDFLEETYEGEHALASHSEDVAALQGRLVCGPVFGLVSSFVTA